MPSLRSRFFFFLFRNRNLLQFKLKKQTALDWQNSLSEVRALTAKTAKMLGKLPKGVEAVPVVAAGVPSEWIQPVRPERENSILLYFHGGGYVLGSVADHRGIVAKFVKASSFRTLLIGYRLAPENRFPAALDDAITAYRWLLAQGYSPANIALAGDSAGGGLCLATLLALRDQKIPLPAAGVALSPWTDLKHTGESLRSNATFCLSPPDSWIACANHYLGGQDPENPYASPLYGDLNGLPPLLIFAGGQETLRDDSIRFAQKAKDAGVDVTLRVGEGMCHCYPACAPLFPEATEAMAEIGDFLRAHLVGAVR